jgi:transcription-repair coupling factor (superfamily II helicase)
MDELLSLLATDHKRINLAGLQGSSYAFVAARIAAKIRRPLLFIAPSERQAELAVQDISLFSSIPVILYPGFDIPPYTPLSPDQTTVAERHFIGFSRLMNQLSLLPPVNHCCAGSCRKVPSGLWQN